jgi:imidazolonepropionase-like amidohydrolase
LLAGAPADLVAWDADRPEEALTALSPCRLAVKGGRVTVEHVRSFAEPWRGRRPERSDSP